MNKSIHYIKLSFICFKQLFQTVCEGPQIYNWLYYQEVDLAATSLMVTYSRGQVIDFTVQFYNDEIPLMIPYPELDRKINGLAKNFQLEVKTLK